MPFKDPEVRKAYIKAYTEANKEKVAEYHKAYHKTNYQANKGRILEYGRAYNQTPKGKKTHIIGNWKHRGLIHDDYNALYDSYLQRTHCDVCKSEFKDSLDRCLDHDHDTGLFRQFLCQSCNKMDNWLKLQTSS